MRTEEDLRDAFDRLADTAPRPDEIRQVLERGGRRAARRRTALIVVTAAATATAAVAAVLTPRLFVSGDGSADQETRSSAWARWVGLSLPKDIYATTQVYGPNRQDSELQVVNGTPWPTFCQLQVHRNGDFDPGRIPPGSPTVTLGGHQVRIVASTRTAPFPPGPQGYRFPLFGDMLKSLVWQPAEGLWALLTCESQRRLGTVKIPTIDGPFDPDVRVASAIARSLSGRQELGSPFVANGLPDGLSARRITYSPAKGNVEGSGEDFTVMFSDGNPGTGYRKPPSNCSTAFKSPPPKVCPEGNLAYQPQVGDDIEIRYSTGKFWNSMSRYAKPVAIIHGMNAYYAYATGLATSETKNAVPVHDAVRLEGNGVAITIRSLAPNPSLDELRGIAENLRLTNSPNNPASWFDAATSIP
ncbi:hypothetical protein ACFWUU_01025 [Kribbella sp. NPDC058693]|uniref:hypothetical protein n=1 Tax=Kribbella sp. NPDC058693 TaxID=3346602 RepID=UPI0036471154